MRTLKSLTLALLLVAALAPTALAAGKPAEGARLDPSFGEGGKTVVSSPKFGWEEFAGYRIATSASGASYAVQGQGFVVYGFAPNGKPSQTFGQNGRVRLPIYVESIAVDPQGRVLVAGTVSTGNDAPTGPTTALPVDGSETEIIRYLPNGSPDPHFGTDGVVKADFGLPLPTAVPVPQTTGTLTWSPGPWSYERPVITTTALAVDSQGRPVIAGSYAEDIGINCTSRNAGFVARLTPEGALDTSFGTGGHAVVQTGAQGASRPLIAPTPGAGFAVLVGPGFPDSCAGPAAEPLSTLTSLTEAGATSPGFAANGQLHVLERIAVDHKGRILLLASAPMASVSPAGVTRLLPNGALDAGFGTDGSATLKATGFESISGLLADARGRVVVGGANVETGKFELARFDAAGKPESRFGSKGVMTVGFGAGVAARLGGLALDPKGRILAAGPVSGSGVKGGVGFGIARLLPGR